MGAAMSRVVRGMMSDDVSNIIRCQRLAQRSPTPHSVTFSTVFVITTRLRAAPGAHPPHPRTSSDQHDLAVESAHSEEIWSKSDLDVIDEIYAPDFMGHYPGTP